MKQSVTQWLESLDMGRYAQAFASNEIDFDVLQELDDADLKDLGVLLGHRKKLLKAIALLSEPHPQGVKPSGLATSKPERRQLTVMFCDLVGSTALASQMDPEDVLDLIGRYHKVVAHEAASFGGHVAKYMGDGVLCYFGWPIAHEDSGERAVRASLSIMEALKDLKTANGSAVSARIGIATGLVVVGKLIGEGTSQEQSVAGETPNLAARLQEHAEPGQILISERTKDLLGASFDVIERPPAHLKGIGEPVIPYVVKRARAAGSRFEARSGQAVLPLVGRDEEFAKLVEHWSRASSGSGQGVLLAGEAGIGKSRLARALVEVVAAQGQNTLHLQCSPYHTDSALWPVAQWLAHEAGLGSDDTDDRKLDKIEAFFQTGRADISEAASLAADLLGVNGQARYGELQLTPSAKRVRMLALLADLILRTGSRQPVLLVVEDTHWIDPTTRGLIEQCLDRIDRSKAMILLTSRPENPDLGDHPNVNPIALGSLPREDVEAFVSSLTGDRQLSTRDVETVLSRCDGVPLFVEQMTQMLLGKSDEPDASTGQAAANIPATIQDLLLMRLDQLGPDKGLAQQGACFGRFFTCDQISLTSGIPEADLMPKMQNLVTSGLVDEVVNGQCWYYFKHALVQEAAYESLLRSTRLDLHGKIAQALEETRDETAAEPEVLAHHFSRARMYDKAVEYWQAAGQKAMRASAFVEATGHFSRALEQLRQLPPSRERDEHELILLLSLGDPLVATRGFAAPVVSDTFGRAREICQSLEKTDLQFPVLWGLVSFHIVRGELEKANELASLFLELARKNDIQDLVLTGNYLVGATHFWRGEFDLARHPIANFVELANPEDDLAFQIAPSENPLVDTHSYLAWTLWLLGYPDQGASHTRQCIDLARSLNSFHDLAYSLGFAAWCSQYRREYDRVRDLSTELIALATEQEFPYWLSAAKILRGGGIVREGDFEQGMAEIEAGLEIWGATGSRLFKPSFLQVKAEALMDNGQFEQSVAVIDEALAEVASTNERLNEAELVRLKGQSFLLAGQVSEAERWFTEAIGIARRQTAKTFELRATASLADLWRQQGKGSEAHQRLNLALGWFQEGFETPDLREAQALLDALEPVATD